MFNSLKFFAGKLLGLMLFFLLTQGKMFAQASEQINWISFSQLNDSLKTNPKKVFVNFYADWCTYCKEMDRTTFTNKKVIEILNKDYYAVKMNIESRDTVLFGDQTFVNKRYKRVNPVHEIALLMAGRKNKPFSLPAFVFLDEKFIATARYFQFLDASSMVNILARQEQSN